GKGVTRRTALLLALLIALLVLAGFMMINDEVFLSPTELAGPTITFWEPEIVIATVDLPAGITIPANALTTCVWPVAVIPQRAYTRPRDLIGRRTRVDIPRGMPIVMSQILPGTAVPMQQILATSPAFQCADPYKLTVAVVALREIQPGETIPKEAISVERWLAEASPPGSLQGSQLVVGKVAGSVIPKGTVILRNQLTDAAIP